MDIIKWLGDVVSFQITPELAVLSWIGWMLHKRLNAVEGSVEVVERDIIKLRVHTGLKDAA